MNLKFDIQRFRDAEDVKYRGRRRWSPEIRDKIGNGEINLMPDAADDGDVRSCYCPGHALFIEGPQVLYRSAAPADEQNVALAVAVQPLYGANNLLRGAFALHSAR